MDTEERSWPPTEWQFAIKAMARGSGVLGPENGLFGRFWKAPYEVGDLVMALIGSLRSSANATAAKVALEELRDACRSAEDRRALAGIAEKKGLLELPGWLGPSALPPMTYNDVLEPINAKRLWQIGHCELYPWPINQQTSKPDFVVGTDWRTDVHRGDKGFYAAVSEVGDNIKVGDTADLAGVVKGFGGAVAGKVAAYPDKQVWVLVDLCDIQIIRDGIDLRVLKDLLAAKLKVSVPLLQHRLALHRVSAILPNDVLTFEKKTWG
jgi:hypothetical protein